jgi:hypothetical protein
MRSKFGKLNKIIFFLKMQWMTMDIIMVHPLISPFFCSSILFKSWDLFAQASKKKNGKRKKENKMLILCFLK